MRFRDKVVLVTGGNSGIGRGIVHYFVGEGARVAFTGRDEAKGLAVETEVRAMGGQGVFLPCDLAVEAEVARLIAGVTDWGGQLDVLVNNASVLGPTPMPFLLDYPLEDFRAVLNVNLIAPFLLIKKLLPAMIETGGSIINVTSDAGRHGYPGWGAYGISKFGIEGMSETWAAELEDSNVRINWVDPGNMNTKMHRDAEPDEDPSEWADPKDVTDVFVYLASDESKGVSGQRFEAQEENWGLEDASEAEKTASQGS